MIAWLGLLGSCRSSFDLGPCSNQSRYQLREAKRPGIHASAIRNTALFRVSLRLVGRVLGSFWAGWAGEAAMAWKGKMRKLTPSGRAVLGGQPGLERAGGSIAALGSILAHHGIPTTGPLPSAPATICPFVPPVIGDDLCFRSLCGVSRFPRNLWVHMHSPVILPRRSRA